MDDQRFWLPIVVVVCACINLCCLIVETGKLVRWFVGKFRPAPAMPPLKLGYCQCGHARCDHDNGTGACHVWIGPTKSDPEPGECACQIYIYDPDEDGDDNDDSPEPEPDPSVKELERIGRL